MAKVSLKFQTVERRGRKLMYFPTMTTKLTVSDYKANFRPSAGKDSPIVEAINSVLVNSSKEIIESMTPNLEKAISQKVLDVANRICKHFTYDELFPDTEWTCCMSECARVRGRCARNYYDKWPAINCCKDSF